MESVKKSLAMVALAAAFMGDIPGSNDYRMRKRGTDTGKKKRSQKDIEKAKAAKKARKQQRNRK